MEKNYYKILQIDRNASPEIIEKAYKTLAKKYHPDLQSENNKEKYEEIFKVINEAYQTLSDPSLKASYDKSLSDNEISRDKYDMLYRQNQELKSELNDLQSQREVYSSKSSYNPISSSLSDNSQSPKRYTRNLEYERQIKESIQKAYNDAYIQDLKNRGYKIKYERTPLEYLKNIISVLIVLFLLFLIFQIPFVKKYFINLYNSNPAFKMIIDIISAFFK